MKHRHCNTLHMLFAQPIANNIDVKEVVHVLEELGAEIDNKSGNRIGVKLTGPSLALPHVHHHPPKEDVIQIREFLTTCGIDPGSYPV